MTDSLSVLLTNDDGIDAPGISALYDRLNDDHDVTVVAPKDEQSGCGQTRSFDALDYEERERGYAVDGTPADCVVFTVGALDVTPDIVVSGCNDGPNLGAHILGRSGTVGAAMEAGFLGLPAVAVSLYDWEYEPGNGWNPAIEKFGVAADVTADLVPNFEAGDLLPTADYLTVNAPSADHADNPVLRVTRPTQEYELEATVTENGVDIQDRFWHQFHEQDVPDPEGTDRRACVENEVSISPLTTASGVADGVTPGGLL